MSRRFFGAISRTQVLKYLTEGRPRQIPPTLHQFSFEMKSIRTKAYVFTSLNAGSPSQSRHWFMVVAGFASGFLHHWLRHSKIANLISSELPIPRTHFTGTQAPDVPFLTRNSLVTKSCGYCDERTLKPRVMSPCSVFQSPIKTNLTNLANHSELSLSVLLIWH